MDMDRYIGRFLDGRYEILENIGSGGMAVVYKARCHRLNRLVAIKILKDELIQDEEFRRRFHAESQAVAAMSHPNIVSVYDVSTSDDADYIVMELIDGISLKQYMQSKGILNWKETLHFAIQIGKALDHAHSRGIIHRDIKPHNVMVLKNGSVKVADFGIAQVMSQSNTLTKEALGSVHYISPEQAKGGRVDNRSDLYSLGVVMYEMMTGRPPFDGETPVSVAIQHINGKAVLPSTINPNIPDGLEQIIMKAMSQDPSGRYPSANAMLYDMDEFRKDPTILFDYNNPNTADADATLIHGLGEAVTAADKTVAERTAARMTEQRSDAVPARQRKPSQPQQKKKKKNVRREEVVVEEGTGGRIAGVALVLFSLIAIVAIVIYMVMLFGDGSDINTGKNMVTVPNLNNKVWEDLLDSTDYTVKLEKYSYSDIYAKGRIISQNPDANVQINRGEAIYVVVSAGPEPDVMKMEDLVDLDQETAINFLVNTQGIDAKLIAVVTESSSDVPAGRVIRTDPVLGETLSDSEIIKLYVSKGPEVKQVKMVDFTSDFYNEESAVAWLEMNGFKNYSVQYVESEALIGKVISQSVAAEKTVDVTTLVVLLVSKGTQTDPTTPPTIVTDPEDYVSKRVEVSLPEDISEPYLISIYRDGILIEERDIPAGTLSTQFTLTGKGTMIFRVELSTGQSWDQVVNFDEYVEPDEPVGPDDPLDPEDTSPPDSTDETQPPAEGEDP